MTFAENINRICAEKGTNLTAIVKAIKGSSSFATAINTKGSLPKESEMLEMARLLGCSVMDFFADEEDLPETKPTNEDEKKEWLERTVVEFTVQQVLTDENIDKISTRAMELIEKELQDTSILIGLQERLKGTNKRIKNLMSAIEQGIITPTTKERLEELEEERRDLEGQIAREEMKKPLLTKERIMYWLESFKRGDIEDVEYQRRIIDTLVNSVYVYDDGDKGRKLVLTFNISGNNTLTISSSDIERTAPPNSANPNSVFFIKHTFGFVYRIENARLSCVLFLCHGRGLSSQSSCFSVFA